MAATLGTRLDDSLRRSGRSSWRGRGIGASSIRGWMDAAARLRACRPTTFTPQQGWSHDVVNGQALCRRHNKRKSARVPWQWELTRLARRRGGYFPQGVPTVVVRHLN